MTGVALRPVREGDVEGLAQLHADAWQQAYAGIIPAEILPRFGREQRRLFWRGALEQSERHPWVDVAVAAPAAGEESGEGDDRTGGEEEILGFVWSRLTGQPESGFEAEIVAINVAPRHWRRGIGRRLMAAAVDRLAAVAAGGVYLWVLEDNRAGRAFYDALGGRIVDHGSESFGDTVLPTLAYAWKPLAALQEATR